MHLSVVTKKALLVPPLLFALWLLTDDDRGDDNSTQHHLAVFTALKRHPPSLRVYRALLELTLLLFGTAFSLLIWTRTAGSAVVGHLLFQPPFESETVTYEAVSASEADETQVLAQEDALDADYDSDGEVPLPQDAPALHEPPSAASVAGAALDLLLTVLVSLLFFTLSSAEGGRYIDGMHDASSTLSFVARIAAPAFPLALFAIFAIMTLLPWRRRKNFWVVITMTVSAPFYDVTFRDGFVGDVLTSTVRPMQDLAFTSFYVLSGLQGWWTHDYDLDEAATPVERSWILRTAILPACMVSPLWWRFLQNLRQSNDSKQRWPYLGNALKYLVAAQVAMFGVFDPDKKENRVWLGCFVCATLYQIWWDVFMDWELFEMRNWTVSLRRNRLYPYRIMYWIIFVVNTVLRFCWLLSFLPHKYLDRSGVLQTTFNGDISSILSPLLASAEIIRRTLWGLIRFELEAIKTRSDDPNIKSQLARVTGHKDHDSFSDEAESSGEIELHPMGSDENEQDRLAVVVLPSKWNSPRINLPSDMSANSDLQVLMELCIWATVFASGGMVAAAHRETY